MRLIGFNLRAINTYRVALLRETSEGWFIHPLVFGICDVGYQELVKKLGGEVKVEVEGGASSRVFFNSPSVTYVNGGGRRIVGEIPHEPIVVEVYENSDCIANWAAGRSEIEAALRAAGIEVGKINQGEEVQIDPLAFDKYRYTLAFEGGKVTRVAR